MAVLTRRLATIGGARGFTMLEIITILAVIAIMAAVLTPMVLNYVEDAKRAKAEADLKALAGVILNLTRDVQHFPIYFNGKKTTGDPEIEILRGPGNEPDDSTATPWGHKGSDAKIGELENHLVKNNPAGTASGTPATPYSTSGRFFWKGPYLEKISEDSWGNRYLVNIKNGNPNDGTLTAPKRVIWVLSAGPNGKIETDPNALADSGPAPGGDDLAIRIR